MRKNAIILELGSKVLVHNRVLNYILSVYQFLSYGSGTGFKREEESPYENYWNKIIIIIILNYIIIL